MVDAPIPTEQEYQEQMRNFEINDRPPSFRHSRAFRNFKNPPQPHMCIRDKTVDGEQEVFINVMSWTRIVKPQAPNDPIPLYGGMRVLGGSSRLPPNGPQQEPQAQLSPQNQSIIFAVMANPEVLKKNRNNVDDQDLMALVELMCEFVETMNPGLKLQRQPIVLKDRDLSGELKNIWGAVQAKREKEREQFMFSTAGGKHNPNLVVYTELGPETANNLHNSSFHEEEAGRKEENPPTDGHLNTMGDFTGTTMENGQAGDGTMKSKDVADDFSTSTHHHHSTSTEGNSSSSSSFSSNDAAEKKPALGSGREEATAIDHNNLIDISKQNHHSGSSNRLKESSSSSPSADNNGLNEDNVPINNGFANAQQNNSGREESPLTEGVKSAPLPPSSAQPAAAVLPSNASTPLPLSTKVAAGKAEKEVANVKEKKEKSISGFLQNGFFGKRNKDKAAAAEEKAPKKEGKPKLGALKCKRLLSGNRGEKEDKGSEANAKKGPTSAAAAIEANMNALNLNLRGGAGELETNSQFNEIGQSMTTAK